MLRTCLLALSLLLAPLALAETPTSQPATAPSSQPTSQPAIKPDSIKAFAEALLTQRKLRQAASNEKLPIAKQTLLDASAGQITGSNNITQNPDNSFTYTYKDQAQKTLTLQGIQDTITQLETDALPLDRPWSPAEPVTPAKPLAPGSLFTFPNPATILVVQDETREAAVRTSWQTNPQNQQHAIVASTHFLLLNVDTQPLKPDTSTPIPGLFLVGKPDSFTTPHGQTQAALTLTPLNPQPLIPLINKALKDLQPKPR